MVFYGMLSISSLITVAPTKFDFARYLCQSDLILARTDFKLKIKGVENLQNLKLFNAVPLGKCLDGAVYAVRALHDFPFNGLSLL